MHLALSLRLGFVAGLGVFAVAACSSGTSSGFDPDGGTGSEEAGASSGSSGGSSGSSGSSSGTTADAATSCFDPACPTALCQCKDKTFFSPTGVCKKGGSCDVVGACEDACGTAGFSGGVFEEEPCTGTGQCGKITSQPSVECACNQGFGSNTYPACFNGRCSPSGEAACPKACASEGGWKCSDSGDCEPIICACKDGKNPVVPSPCSGGACSTPTAQCGSACGTHGGWAGTPVTPPDAGPVGPKQPGDSCSISSECGAFSCSCNNGATFNGSKLCQNKTCATKSQTCGLSCMGNGGWSGT